jgi:hypothetical protein
MKNAAFGVKGLGYKQEETMEVSGKHKSSGYSDKLKKIVKESLIKEEITNPPAKTAEDLAKKVMAWYDFDTNYIDDGGQRKKALKDNENVVIWFNKHDGEMKAAATRIIKDKTGESIKENSNFEDKMAQLRALKDKQRMGQAPDPRVDSKKQRLQQKLNNIKRAYSDLISDMEKESDINFASSGDWYQEQLDDLENSISDIENKINQIGESTINEGKSSKPSLDSDLAEIDTQANIVAVEAKLDKISEMIEAKNQRLNMIDEDINLAELVDKTKIKGMQKEIKLLEKKKAQMEKLYEKMTGKSYTKEMVDEDQAYDEVEEGIHDKDITSAPHTNIKTPPKGVGDYDPAKRAASLKRLANFGPKN